jgi:hypothetical protein
VDVAAGEYYSVARRSDGSVVAWGKNTSGQCDVPPLPSGVTYVELAAGDNHCIARRSDGTAVAWGFNGAGQCDVPGLPAGLTYVEVAAGFAHSLARRSDGAVLGWGYDLYNECAVPALPAGLAYSGITAGGEQSIVLYAGCPICELPFCLGDAGARSVPCPCGNNGASGRGCDNSASTGGAMLTVRSPIDPDRVVLITTGERPSAQSIFVQGNSVLGDAVVFGDGVRCIGGALKRIGVKTAVAGAASYPGPGDPSIRARSAALGDPISPGTYRYYQVYYHDPSPAFCNAPRATFNVSNAVIVAW